MFATNLRDSEYTSEAISLAESLHELLRHHARTKEYDTDMLAALRLSYSNSGDLFVQGFLRAAAAQPEGKLYPYIVKSLPELWWIDSEMSIDLSTPLASSLVATVANTLAGDTQDVVNHLDRHNPRLELGTSDAIFTAIMESDGDLSQRSRTLARGLAMAMSMAPSNLPSFLNFVGQNPSAKLLSAMASDERLLGQEHWISTLVLRGGRVGIALGAVSLLHAPERILARLRDLLCMAPASVFQRVAEVHGLLTLAGEDGLEASEYLRTALLSQGWQGNDLRGIAWTQAFRGEQIVSRSLAEIPQIAHGLAVDVLRGLPELLDLPLELADPGRREPMAQCLAWLTQRDPGYCAGMRNAEGRIREIGRTLGSGGQREALRHYVVFLLSTARTLLKRGDEGYDGALKIYTRILRLRKSYPELITQEMLPNTLFGASKIRDPERAARRWVVREQADLAGAALNMELALADAPQSSADEFFPLESEGVTTLDGLSELPSFATHWAGPGIASDRRWYLRYVPVPVHFLFTALKRMLGFQSSARVHMREDGKSMLVRQRSLWGKLLPEKRHLLPEGCLMPYPLHRTQVDRMLGRWSAFLLAACTIGAFFTLQGLQNGQDMRVLFGSVSLVAGLLGYGTAFRLHCTLRSGLAFVASDSAGRSHLWRIDAATRHLMTRPGKEQNPV
ncbi:MAG TPA: hypothetical protein EYN06_06535 [Myxococcales bacterium]|nr:hypothetical protein [Myxococcales bacterium]